MPEFEQMLRITHILMGALCAMHCQRIHARTQIRRVRRKKEDIQINNYIAFYNVCFFIFGN